MKISAGKVGFKAQIQLHCRAFLVSWVDKKNVITCLKNRDYRSSSVPVRYIPKTSNQSKKLESSDSDPVKISKRKDFIEFSERCPQLSNEVSYRSNSVRKGFDFDMKTQHLSQTIASDALFDDRDSSIEDSEELSVHQQRSIYSDRSVEQALEDETTSDDEKFAMSEVSQDQNVARKSFNFDMRLQYPTQMLANDSLLRDVRQDRYTEEPLEDSNSDDILEEHEDELSEEDDVLKEHEELDEELSIHKQNRSNEHNDLRASKGKSKLEAEKAAVKLLASRAFTTVELRKRLCGKRFPPIIVEAVINEYQSRGLLNDGWYAEAFCQSKWSSSTWGPRRIKQQLSLKGVSKLDTENAIRLVFEDGESDNRQTLSHGLSKVSMDRLFVQASKQWSRGSDIPKEKRKERIVRWLQYRGFNWGVVGFIVKRLESDNHLP